jgi:hypothetical protein
MLAGGTAGVAMWSVAIPPDVGVFLFSLGSISPPFPGSWIGLIPGYLLREKVVQQYKEGEEEEEV